MPTAEIVDTVQFSETEKQQAEIVATQLGSVLTDFNQTQKQLSTNCIKLGRLLLEVREKHYWRLYGQPTYGSYIDSVMEKTGRGRTQIYAYISTVDKLDKFVSEQKLLQMGISKAAELAKLIGKTGIPPNPELIEAAADESLTLAELKASIFASTHYKELPYEPGVYYDFGGAHLTVDERALFDRAFKTAFETDPVVSKELPEHIRRKEAYMRWAMEYLATYEGLAEKGQA